MSTIVITGASSGIGKVAATVLAAQGWDVAVVGRNPERTAAVAAAVGGTPFLADYDRLDDVRALAAALLERYSTIDVLTNNAGGLVSKRGVTEDGNERTIQHNHLAPFLLTNLLLSRLEQSSARVISTASSAHLFGRLAVDNLNRDGRPYLGGWRAYGTSKIATILFTTELARRSTVTAYSFHPGFVGTSFGHDSRGLSIFLPLSGALQRTPEQGAAPIVELASEPVAPAPSGTYFDGLKPNGMRSHQAKDSALASRLWETSARLVGIA